MSAVVVEPNAFRFSTVAPEWASTSRLRSGFGTVSGRFHSIASYLPQMTSTMLAAPSLPPHWASSVLEDLQRFDEDSVLTADAVSRLLQAISILPWRMPKPEVGVGDDGTVGLEWDFESVGIEIYVSNHSDEDSFIIDTGDGDIIEVPLFPALSKVVRVLDSLSSR